MTVNTHPHRHDQECHHVLTQLNDYADGELPRELCQELESHLAECDNCRIVLDTLKKTIYLIRHIDDQPQALPEDVEHRLFAVLDLEDFLPSQDAENDDLTHP